MPAAENAILYSFNRHEWLAAGEEKMAWLVSAIQKKT
jgi:hypothetical protein